MVYVPRYFQGEFAQDAYSWAFPVGVSGALIASFLSAIIRRKAKFAQKDETLNMFAVSSGIVGLLLILVGFISIVRAPAASVDRYVNDVAYALLLIPTAAVCSQFIGSRKRLLSFCLIALFMGYILIGSSCPDWAPLENSTFGATAATYTGFVEASTIVKFLPNNITIYCDYDIPLGGVAWLNNVSFTGPESFQTTRNILDSIKDGTFNPYTPFYENAPETFASLNSTYTVKTDQIQNYTVIDDQFNVVYNSGFHILLITPHK